MTKPIHLTNLFVQAAATVKTPRDTHSLHVRNSTAAPAGRRGSTCAPKGKESYRYQLTGTEATGYRRTVVPGTGYAKHVGRGLGGWLLGLGWCVRGF